ncbi:uncharacterized protein si:ch211-266a5.12 [Pimephales promelas]|uniref:uncharacterized protein si:ch211-266a5.12 n=1 Tax=Pimephales promelas TaxID=90988 RepID=UPI001955A9E0|nr:uncharacterized protein si:ch211-266a5.12 [Pimephales promelas]KAG1953103.1 hypothetical protein F2P79_009810 [Pimephales promelas]
MASALQYFVLVLILGIQIHECTVVFQNENCIKEGPCFDLNLLANIAVHVSKDVVAADGEKILLRHNSFDKIRRKKNLHSCILQKIIDLFQKVLIETEKTSVPHKDMNYHRELIHILDQLRNCVYKIKCTKLDEKAATSSINIPEKEMKPKQLAILQLQKLKNANESLSDVHIQQSVMDELKTLHSYMRGKGFRKNTIDYGEE